MQHAGIGQQFDARLLRCGDDVAMLRNPRAQFVRRNQQQPVDACKCGVQCFRFCVVALTKLDTISGEATGSGRVANKGDDLRRRHGLEQGGDDETAELAVGAGDENFGRRHGWLRLVFV
jgi:hypothetical protein